MKPDLMSLLNPIRIFANLWGYRELTWRQIKREVSQRYMGTFLGFLWAWVVPLLMLIVYTFVFSVIFKARWRGDEAPPMDFALILFAGLTAFDVFGEVVNSAPRLVLGVPSYVKKVVFPLETLTVVRVGSSLIHSFFSVVILVVLNAAFSHTVSSTIYLLPLAYLPLIFLCLGLGWFLASLGVYVRDIAQVITIITQALFFTSPVFYPIEAVPPFFQSILQYNPLMIILYSFRQTLLWGEPLMWKTWGIWLLIDLVIAILGYAWFMKTKPGFADVM